MAPNKTTLEERGPALVTLADRGKGEGMPFGANYPSDEAREPEKELSVAAKFIATAVADVVPSGLPGVTTSGWMSRAAAALDACGTGRPSVSRVPEIGMHGLKGGFRNPGSQEHRA
jgi:hypothetical protein